MNCVLVLPTTVSIVKGNTNTYYNKPALQTLSSAPPPIEIIQEFSKMPYIFNQ